MPSIAIASVESRSSLRASVASGGKSRLSSGRSMARLIANRSCSHPYRADSKLKQHKLTQLDRLYQKVVDDLDELLGVVGLKVA
jgi:hypothetical protein